MMYIVYMRVSSLQYAYQQNEYKQAFYRVDEQIYTCTLIYAYAIPLTSCVKRMSTRIHMTIRNTATRPLTFMNLDSAWVSYAR